jgi:hypothetical protein
MGCIREIRAMHHPEIWKLASSIIVAHLLYNYKTQKNPAVGRGDFYV